MGILKKIGKGLKKVVKGVAKGIKKVFKKVTGVFGKLGIVGQLGLMFLGVPPIIKDFFSGLAGGMGSFISKLGKTDTIFGRAMSQIHKAGSALGDVYTSISDAISNGIDRAGNFLKGEGFTLSDGRKSVFTKEEVPTLDELKKQASEVVKLGDKSTESILSKVKTYSPDDLNIVNKMNEFSGKGGGLNLKEVLYEQLSPEGKAIYNSTPKHLADQINRMASSEVTTSGMETSIKNAATDYIPEDSILSKSLKAGLRKGITSGVATNIAGNIAGDPPVHTYLNLNQFITPTKSPLELEEIVFNKLDKYYLEGGSSFGLDSLVAQPYYSAIAGNK